MIRNRQNIILAALAGFLSWVLLADNFPVVRYVCYSFLIGVFFALLTIAALILLNVRDLSPTKQQKAFNLSGSSLKFLKSPEKWTSDAKRRQEAAHYQPRSLYASSFVVSEGIDDLISLALRDFISSWYDQISASPVFRNEVDRAIRDAIAQCRSYFSRCDLVDVLVSRIVPIITQHLKEFDVAERAVRGKNLSRTVTETEELDFAIASKFKDGNCHPAACISLSAPNQPQQDHVRKVVSTLLPVLLPPEQLQSQAVVILLREIFTCSVLIPLINVLRDPDTWNRLIEAYGRTALHDRKTVRKLRAALDQHAPAPRVKQSLPFPQLTVHASERDFERFVRAIRRCNNLSDVRKFRNYVSSQLKRESTAEGQDSVYIRRLETSKRVLDQKVARLSMLSTRGTDANIKEPQTSSPSNLNASSLVDIMHNASSLSHFMEYMDRLNKMSLVQFWIVVDGFRNPLEDDFGDESTKAKWTTADWNDIVLINETYLSKPELHVSAESRQDVANFIQAGRKATLEQYRKARTAILSSQSAVLEEMQNQYYPGFKSSDLYFKCLALDEAAASVKRDSGTSQTYLGHQKKRSNPLNDAKNQVAGSHRISDTQSETMILDHSPLLGPPRLSLDSERQPLFDDDLDSNVLTLSSSSMTDYPGGEGDSSQQTQVLESMEAALNDIIAAEPHQDLRSDSGEDHTAKPAGASQQLHLVSNDKLDKGKPNIASLGLVNPVGRIGVFTDNDLFPDEEKFLEDEYADPISESDEDNILKDIHPAAPGDLGLAEAIMALNEDIEKLIAQEYVVDALTKKAELTNNAAELRILGKSKSSLQREIRRKEMQRQQYIIQEGDTGLYGRSSVQIKSIIIGKEEDKREFASCKLKASTLRSNIVSYQLTAATADLVEVRRNASDRQAVASWVVPRRYSEFHELHQRLRSQYRAVRNLEFPRRRVVMKLQKDFLQKRRIALESYLQQLLELPEVCRSRELRSFLSQRTIAGHRESSHEGDSKDIMSRIYSSVADGMDDILGNIAVLDQLSVAGQTLINHLSNNASPSLGTNNLATDEDAVSAAEAEAELNAFENRELEPFVKPICDIFLELFSLNRGNSWFRGRAVVVVLHQLLGGTVERKVRDMAHSLVAEASLLRFTAMIKDTFWPDGGPLHVAEKRTLSEKMKSRAEASITLATLIPDLAASVVGRANAQEAARKIFATLNNERLNTHLVHTILDELVLLMFGTK
ncbi:Intermediate filament protein [Ascosphaera aggregata]|nr:Intermediate filament protein [Ascosphaera aggregata]